MLPMCGMASTRLAGRLNFLLSQLPGRFCERWHCAALMPPIVVLEGWFVTTFASNSPI